MSAWVYIVPTGGALVALLAYVVLYELRLQRRVKRASWDLDNARPGYITFDSERSSNGGRS